MRLTDCFGAIIAYVAYFARSVPARQPALEQVKADIQRLISESQTHVSRGEVNSDDCDAARFAIVAWIDETIMNSAWIHRDLWKHDLLQRTYYNTTDAGEIFFDRLNRIGLQQREVREVYYLCLAMGFQGRYCHPGDDFLLEQLKSSNLKLLTGSSLGLPSLEKGELFPEAYPTENDTPPMRSHRRLNIATLAAMAFPVVLFAGLYFIYTFILNSYSGSLLSKVL
jgi:type VI secretion system protein ImpK